MKEVKLTVNDELERLLVQFLHTDNRGTHNPIYLVETQQQSIVFDGGMSGDHKYYSNDNKETYDTPEELIFETIHFSFADNLIYPFYEIKPFDELKDVYILDLEDYFEAYGVNAEIVSEIITYRPVAYFFSEEEAKKYIEYQSHNLTKPRTYANSPGYSNYGDWDPFYVLLREAAKQCEVTD